MQLDQLQSTNASLDSRDIAAHFTKGISSAYLMETKQMLHHHYSSAIVKGVLAFDFFHGVFVNVQQLDGNCCFLDDGIIQACVTLQSLQRLICLKSQIHVSW